MPRSRHTPSSPSRPTRDHGPPGPVRGGPSPDRGSTAAALHAGDTAYYTGDFRAAQAHFQRALASAEAARRPNPQVAEASLNLAMLHWRRKESAKHDALLETCERELGTLPESTKRDVQRCDVAIWASSRARWRGDFKAAELAVAQAQQAPATASGQRYRKLRVTLERANIARNRGQWSIAKRLLKQLGALISAQQTPDPDWPPETVLVLSLMHTHALGVLTIDQLLLSSDALGSPPPTRSATRQAEEAVLARSNLLASQQVAGQSDRGDSPYQLYVWRNEKALGWVDWLCGHHDEAEQRAARVLSMGAEQLDPCARVAAELLRAAAVASRDGWEAGAEDLSAAFEAAVALNYWKAQVLGATIATRCADHAGNAAAADLWRRRRSALLAGREVALDAEDDGVRFARLAQRWRDETELLSSVTKIVFHPAYQGIMAMGRAALPWIFDDLRERGPDHWHWALHHITGEDPVPPECAGKLGAIRDRWLAWAEASGYGDG